MKIRHKIILGFALVVSIKGLESGYSFISTTEIAQTVESVATKPLSAIESARAIGDHFRLARDIATESLNYADLRNANEYLHAFDNYFRQYENDIKTLKELMPPVVQAELNNALKKSIEWHTSMSILLRDEPSTSIKPTYYFDTIEGAIIEHLDSAIKLATGYAESMQEEIADRVSFSQTIDLIVLLVGISLALIVFGSIAVQTVGPLRELEEAMESVARNEFDKDVRIANRDDELGAMAKALKVFQKNAVELIEHRDHLQELVEISTRGLKLKAEELKQALSKEKDLNRLQQQFVSMASHEFRTPLAIIDGAAQRIEGKIGVLSEDQTRKGIGDIRGAVKRMSHLMESTLSAAKMEQGELTVEMGSCDLKSLVQDTCLQQQQIYTKHDIVIEADDLPDHVSADSFALEQILTNLISNAVKYSPDATKVVVRGAYDETHATVSVQDFGRGIDDDELPKLFDRFFRARTSTGIAGTGIGLNLAKALIEKHGGRITVESKVGDGSVFTIWLPIGNADDNSRDDDAAIWSEVA